jgi:ribosomal protein S18 acetylase RimI-like enzyme
MLYLKHGYQRVETWVHYYQGGEDGILMEKQR